MTTPSPQPIRPDTQAVLENVRAALAEDVGSGDITAALIPAGETATARVITREAGVLCGRPWVDQVFHALDPAISVSWRADDGAALLASDHTHVYVCGLKGMEDGVMDALRYAADSHGLAWKELHPRLKSEGRLHLETY